MAPVYSSSQSKKLQPNMSLVPSPLIKQFSNFVPVSKINLKGPDTKKMYPLVS